MTSPQMLQNLDNLETVKLVHTVHGKSAPPNLEPIIVLHSLLGSNEHWQDMAKKVNKKTGRQVYCVDARNHGASPYSEEMSYAVMAADLRRMIEEESLAPAIIIGQSMGGRTAMLLAILAPETVRKVIIVDIPSLGSPSCVQSMHEYIQALQQVQIEPGISKSKAEKIADKQLKTKIENAKFRKFALANLVQNIDKSYTWKVNLEVIANKFLEELACFPNLSENAKFEGPALFITGAKSELGTPDDQVAIRHLFPNATFVCIKDAAHRVYDDKPKEFFKALLDFLKE